MSASEPMDLLGELNRLENLRDQNRSGQRQFPRYFVRDDAELHPIDASRIDRTPVEIKLRDISRGGIGFICQQNLPVDSNWRVAFIQRRHVVAQQAVTIRHCREVRPSVFLVGAQVCFDAGLLITLGLDPDSIDAEADADSFVAPDDLGK